MCGNRTRRCTQWSLGAIDAHHRAQRWFRLLILKDGNIPSRRRWRTNVAILCVSDYCDNFIRLFLARVEDLLSDRVSIGKEQLGSGLVQNNLKSRSLGIAPCRLAAYIERDS